MFDNKEILRFSGRLALSAEALNSSLKNCSSTEFLLPYLEQLKLCTSLCNSLLAYVEEYKNA